MEIVVSLRGRKTEERGVAGEMYRSVQHQINQKRGLKNAPNNRCFFSLFSLSFFLVLSPLRTVTQERMNVCTFLYVCTNPPTRPLVDLSFFLSLHLLDAPALTFSFLLDVCLVSC